MNYNIKLKLMNNYISILIIFFLLTACKNDIKNDASQLKIIKPNSQKIQEVINVASFKGQQVTGITVTKKGRMFVNFPRWRDNVRYSVVEVFNDGTFAPFPNEEWNLWNTDKKVISNQFVGIQSVVAFENKLYVLDTRNSKFSGVIDAPRVFVFNLISNKLEQTFKLNKDDYHNDSYINDLRVDVENNKLYFTDSGHAGLIALDLKTGNSKRILDNHKSTKAEVSQLIFGKKTWKNTVHSDGIALDTRDKRLYYHALTGYSLYSIPISSFNLTNDSEIEATVKFEVSTSATDGMIFDQNGNLYFADLENNKINYLTPNGTIKTLLTGEHVKWADTFSIYDGYLYYTNSRINETTNDISDLEFTINKIKLPQ